MFAKFVPTYLDNKFTFSFVQMNLRVFFYFFYLCFVCLGMHVHCTLYSVHGCVCSYALLAMNTSIVIYMFISFQNTPYKL